MADGNALGILAAYVIVPYDCAAGLGVFDGIIQQIDNDLLHLARVDLRMAVCGGTVEVFIEPLSLPPTLLVIGGGHVGRALAQLGKWMEYRVILSDDRPEFCSAEYLPGLDAYVVCKPGEVTTRVQVNRSTFIAAVTRGMPVDLNLVPALLATEAPYIGLIGSRRRWSLTVRALKEERGLTDAQLDRIRAPIGLELEAETPKEIAISIMAEIIMLRRGGTGKPMHAETRIHNS